MANDGKANTHVDLALSSVFACAATKQLADEPEWVTSVRSRQLGGRKKWVSFSCDRLSD